MLPAVGSAIMDPMPLQRKIKPNALLTFSTPKN